MIFKTSHQIYFCSKNKLGCFYFKVKIKAFPYWEGYLIININININIAIKINFQLVYQGNLMQTLRQLL